MADIVGACCAVFQGVQPICRYLKEKTDYIRKFDENLDNLNSALGDLNAKRVDLLRKVKAEEIKGLKPLAEVERWLSKVQTSENNPLVADAYALQQKWSNSWLYRINFISTYRCGKKIPRMLIQVNELVSTSNFVEVVALDPPSIVELVPEVDEEIFGLDGMLQRTENFLMDAGTRTLGLYGMGGVGKTTLLSLINNKLTKLQEQFHVVILVKVSKDVDIEKIQDEIGKRIGLYDEKWSQKTERDKRSDISRVLTDTKPRFVLLLDDLWDEVGLTKIGIPVLGREYKIVFTSRSENLCRRMRVNLLIEVNFLEEMDALKLLTKNAGRDRLEDEMLEHAKDIVRKCKGLPLALKVIGKCLSCKRTAAEWREVLNNLESYPDVVEGMERNVFAVLKVSYDNLEKEDTKLCFQYCALFPRSYNISRDELVEYWIGEGILDVNHERERAKCLGLAKINDLVGAGLLLESKQKLYMHDIIREMALSIVSAVREGKRYIVKTDAGLSELPVVMDWPTVTKISLMNNHIKSITNEYSRFPNPDQLVTLFLQNNKLVDIVGRFFCVLSTLVVLDLSHNLGITELPEDISKLVSLRYLNLLGTWIKSLPKDFSKLISLIHLDLESTSNLRDIGPISGLVNLQVLRFYRSASLDVSLLESLGCMENLHLLTITVEEDLNVLDAFLGSKSAKRTEGLYLNRLEVSGVSGKSFAATFGELGSLSKLGLEECNIIESEAEWRDNKRNHDSPSTSSNQSTLSNTWFENLTAVVLISCEGLTDLTWLIYAAKLEFLSVKTSPNMEEVISKEKAGDIKAEPFRQLQVLELEFMVKLKSIYWISLSFPKLQKVHIIECPNLRKLPLSSTSVDKNDDLRIEVDEQWLQQVEWETGAQERFHPSIRRVSVP